MARTSTVAYTTGVAMLKFLVMFAVILGTIMLLNAALDAPPYETLTAMLGVLIIILTLLIVVMWDV